MNKQQRIFAGLIIAVMVVNTMPVLAESIDVLFRTVTIHSNGVTTQTGSIQYKGNTYIPINTIGSVFNKEISYGETDDTIILQEKGNNSSVRYTGLNETVAIGSPFYFDYLKLTVGGESQRSRINNKYSDYDGMDVIKLPIKITNTSNKNHSLNKAYMTCNSPSGEELKDINIYFDDSFSRVSSSIKSGCTIDAYLYILYDGQGSYLIEFDNKYEYKQMNLSYY